MAPDAGARPYLPIGGTIYLVLARRPRTYLLHAYREYRLGTLCIFRDAVRGSLAGYVFLQDPRTVDAQSSLQADLFTRPGASLRRRPQSCFGPSDCMSLSLSTGFFSLIKSTRETCERNNKPSRIDLAVVSPSCPFPIYFREPCNVDK